MELYATETFTFFRRDHKGSSCNLEYEFKCGACDYLC